MCRTGVRIKQLAIAITVSVAIIVVFVVIVMITMVDSCCCGSHCHVIATHRLRGRIGAIYRRGRVSHRGSRKGTRGWRGNGRDRRIRLITWMGRRRRMIGWVITGVLKRLWSV